MTKISDLSALTGAGVDQATDLLPIVDMSETGAARNKKITVAELLSLVDMPGALEFKGSTDCSANPNYPAGEIGDFYIVSVAGKIGGASGVTVEVGDAYFAKADNAGGTQASVGTSWTVIQGNIISSGIPTTLDDLSDVNAPAPSDGDVLTWDATPGEWVPAAPTGGGGSGIDIEDEGVSEATGATILNFTGAGVTATDVGGGQVDIDIPGGGGGGGFGTVDMSGYTITGGPLSAPTETTDSDFGYGLSHASANVTTNNFWFRTRAFSGDLTLITRVQVATQSNGNNSLGIVFRQSGATTFVALLATWSSGIHCEVSKSTNDGASSSGVGSSQALSGGSIPIPTYLRAVYTASSNTLTMSVSNNGVHWIQLYSGTTDVTPNQVGVTQRIWTSTGPLPGAGVFKYWNDPGVAEWNLP